MYNFLERKLGKHAIKNLMKYVIIMYITGFFVYYIGSARGVDIYDLYLCFDVDKILDGEVWRVVSWLIQPLTVSSTPMMAMFFMMITLFFYYMIGSTLERFWGSFRFNMFYFSGILLNIVAGFLVYLFFYLTCGKGYSFPPITLKYINLSMFLAFSALFSDVQVLLMFVIPIKIKYLAYLYIGLELYDIVEFFIRPLKIYGFDVVDNKLISIYNWQVGVALVIMCVVSLLNFLLFWLGAKKRGMAQFRRQRQFQNAYRNGQGEASYNAGVNVTPSGRPRAVITRHKCAVCGRTELDDDELEFRFCSKCDGNYEYCMDHLYTHTHVVRVLKDSDENQSNT